MSYSGGVRADIRDRDTFLAIYHFLRQVLLAVPVEEPYRGPRRFEQAGMIYRNEAEGALDRFHGVETIAGQGGAPLHELRYGGGCYDKPRPCSPDRAQRNLGAPVPQFRFASCGLPVGIWNMPP